jgi:DNA polymerase-3 subunit gamma/tau
VAPPVAAAQPSAPESAKQPVASQPDRLTRPPKGTGLMDLIAVESHDTPAAVIDVETHSPAAAAANTPFRVEDLINCWNAYSETLKEEIHLKNTMINCKPVLRDASNFEVVVHNPSQKEELLSNSLRLLKFMRSELKNNSIQMHIRIDHSNEKQLTYTASERYEYLSRINPMLSKLIEKFDLTID